MINKLSCWIVAMCISLSLIFTAGCGCNHASNSTDLSSISKENSQLTNEDVEGIENLMELWSVSYATHYLTMYNECVSSDLAYGDNSKNDNDRTTNFFDTVTDCIIDEIHINKAKKIDEATIKVPVDYTITCNDKFEETETLKKGKNKISAYMTIKRSVTGSYYIDSIE